MVWSNSADVYDSLGVSSIFYVAMLHRGRPHVKLATPAALLACPPLVRNGGFAVRARSFWDCRQPFPCRILEGLPVIQE